MIPTPPMASVRTPIRQLDEGRTPEVQHNGRHLPAFQLSLNLES